MTTLASPYWRPILPWAAALVTAATGVLLAVSARAPIWLIGVIALAPWLPLLSRTVLITRKLAGGWVAFYLALVISQVGHVGEHVAQIIQLRLLGLPGTEAHGIFGALDIEAVHFVWNAWILVAVTLLLARYRANPWLWLSLPLAGWHLIEHVVLMAIYLATGLAGSAGLLAAGGLLGGGLALARPDLHLLYNVAETVPLVIGLGWVWRRIRAR